MGHSINIPEGNGYSKEQWFINVHDMNNFVLKGARKSYLIVKVGDPDNSYLATLSVRVSDLYKNYVEFKINIQVLACQPRVIVTSCFVYNIIKDL